MDGGATDATTEVPDAAPDVVTRPDAARQPDPCDRARVVDLDSDGSRAGRVTTYTGTTAMGPTTQVIAPPANCVGGNGGMAVRQIAHTFTVANTAILKVSTHGSGTPTTHDTVVWLQDTCDTRGQTYFGCNDDSDGNTRSTAYSATPITAGTAVTIVVATYSNSSSAIDGMAYELSVEEVVPTAVGAECVPSLTPDLCIATATCVGAGQVGHCIGNGTLPRTRCREDSAPGGNCDTGLTCVEASDTLRLCLTAAALGAECSVTESHCPDNARCIVDAFGQQLSGHCRADGTAGGVCTTAIACTASGTTCSTTTDNTIGFCQQPAADGAACDPLGERTACTMGHACVPAATGTDTVCAAPGTAAGSACRDSAPRCDTGLDCTAMSGAGVCQTTVTTGACDPRYGRQRCAAPSVCMATGALTGTCTMPVAEQPAAHSNLTTAQAVTPPVAIAGSIQPATDVDCYSFTVPEGGSLYVEVNDGAGACPSTADPLIAIYNAVGQSLTTGDDSRPLSLCPLLDGRERTSPLHGLHAGAYAVCVQAYPGQNQLAIPAYDLDLTVVPAATP